MKKIAKGLSRARAHSRALRVVDSEDEPPPADAVGAAAATGAVGALAPEVGIDAGALAPEIDGDPGDAPLALDRLRSVQPDPRVLERNRIVIDELTGASSAYKMLRTRVLQRMRRNSWKTLAVTGTCPGEGKSLTAINLSINLARDVGTTAILVDLDLRKPSIHRQLGVSSRYGVGDFLRGSVSLAQAAVRPGIDRLGVVLNQRSYANSSEMLASPQAASLVEQAKRGEGRIVVFDLPPILASDDLLAFCPLVDAVLVVVAQGQTKQADMAATRELLQDVNVVGAVLNKSSEEVAPYYYGPS